MNDRFPEDRERQISHQFDMGARSNQENQDADRILDDYQFVRETLQTFPVWKVNEEALSQRIENEYKKRARQWLPLAASFALLLFTAVYSWTMLSAPAFSAVASIEFTQANSNKPAPVPYIWSKRIQRGKRVTVPNGLKAQLELSDGSSVGCESGTQISIDFSKNRNIFLQHGYVSINAANVPNTTMTVFTPLNRVEVVGTKFWIKVSTP